ncbi:hypothetical protein Hanom_Chr01g00035531 [Helianthus anomalus]
MGGGRRGRIVGHNRVRVRVRLTVEKLGEVINRYREGERREEYKWVKRRCRYRWHPLCCCYWHIFSPMYGSNSDV